MVALPSHPDERGMAYVYRDSLPTMAKDLSSAQVYAVLPMENDSPSSGNGETASFAEETKQFLKGKNVRTVDLSELDRLRERFVAELPHV